jgi:hypothetical protein
MPIQINLNCYTVLIQLYVFPDYYDKSKERWEDNALTDLGKHGLIDKNHKVTDRGKCLLEHVSNLSLPIQAWKMP